MDAGSRASRRAGACAIWIAWPHGRFACPSCTGGRMTTTAAFLVDRVLPDVPAQATRDHVDVSRVCSEGDAEVVFLEGALGDIARPDIRPIEVVVHIHG